MQGTLFGRPAVFLLDSGATGNFVSSAFVHAHNLPSSPLSRPDLVTLADGSQQPRAASCSRLRFAFASYSDSLDLVALTLQDYDAILGMPWLERVNPEVNWRQRTVTLLDQHDRRHVLESPAPSQGASLVVVVARLIVVATRQLIGDSPYSLSSPTSSRSRSPHAASSAGRSSSGSRPAASARRPTPALNVISLKQLARQVRRGLVEKFVVVRGLEELETLEWSPATRSFVAPWRPCAGAGQRGGWRVNALSLDPSLVAARVREPTITLSEDDSRRQRQRVSNVCGLRSAHRERDENGGVIQWQMRECSCTDKYESMHACMRERESRG